MAFEQVRAASSLRDCGSALSSHRSGSAMTDRYGKVITVTVRKSRSTVPKSGSGLRDINSGRPVHERTVGVLGVDTNFRMDSPLDLRAASVTDSSWPTSARCQGCRCLAQLGGTDMLSADVSVLPSSYRQASSTAHRCQHHPQCAARAAAAAFALATDRDPPVLSTVTPGKNSSMVMLRRLNSSRWGNRRSACMVCGFRCSACLPVCDGRPKKYCLNGSRIQLVPKQKPM